MKNTTKALENKMVLYQDLLNIKTVDCQEKLVPAQIAIFKNQVIFVRESVNKRLLKAELQLRRLHPNYQLILFCGYRSLETQTKRFLEVLSNLTKKYFENPLDLYESVHRKVAVPTVAGHPTGGAVDIAIFDIGANRLLDFGSLLYDYSTKKHYSFYPGLKKIQKYNRQLLRKVMMMSGFAPFDGEWWHFSFGDREWAFYYQKKTAKYKQVNFKSIR